VYIALFNLNDIGPGVSVSGQNQSSFGLIGDSPE